LLGCRKTEECSPIIADLFEAIANPKTASSSCAWPPRYKKAYFAWLLQNNRVSPDTIADLFEAIANPNNGLIELRVASQVLEACVAWLLQNNCIFPYTIADLSRGHCQPQQRPH
jgi:hypothetical protein